MEQTLLMGSAVKRTGDAYRFIVTLPEIYNTGGAQARQWANLSLWGVNHGYFPIWFAGTFTEWTRCQDPASCSGIDNKPSTNPADIASSTNYVKAALSETLVGKPISQASTRPYGCSVKYSGS